MRCPGCETGIHYDTQLKTVTEVKPEDYPAMDPNSEKYWCKTCQHGTFPIVDGDNQGLCSECADKGRATRLQPKKGAPVDEPIVEEAIAQVEEAPMTTTNMHKVEQPVIEEKPETVLVGSTNVIKKAIDSGLIKVEKVTPKKVNKSKAKKATPTSF